ncbi:Imm63 family immunity protein [Parasphingorhabdus sp.]|uniref:Imm63 family immunity protein n=1 Tax=Parasphingorhabdus sp. TaxID=2709688 RepID=UPI003A920328
MIKWLRNKSAKCPTSYEAVQAEYHRISQGWEGSSRRLPIGTSRTDDGSYHLECASDGKLSLVVTERGNEYERYETYSLEELMYRVFKDQAFAYATKYELAHRHPTDDARIIIFAKQIELLAQLSEDWARRCQSEQEKILKKHPLTAIPSELRR